MEINWLDLDRGRKTYNTIDNILTNKNEIYTLATSFITQSCLIAFLPTSPSLSTTI
jgi:hypothetical protein